MRSYIKTYLATMAALMAACVTTAQFDPVQRAFAVTFDIPSSVDLTFDNSGHRSIYVQDSTGGRNLTVRSGNATDPGVIAGTMYLKSGNGGDYSGMTPAGAGGDLRIIGGDAGDNGSNTSNGSHGGNIHLMGGVGNNALEQHGGILIGETTTDEIRIGHQPHNGTINLGHIRHLGYLADSSSIYPMDLYTIRFENNGTGHLIDGEQQVAGGGAGVPVTIRSAAGGDSTSGVAGAQGGALTVWAADGGDGNSTRAAGYGGPLKLWGGGAGTAGAGGGNVGGSVEVDGGPGTGGYNGGTVYVGNGANTYATYIGHSGASTTIAGLTNPQLVSTSGDQTIKVEDYASAGAGKKLSICGGKGGSGSGGNGGDMAVRAGDSSGGSYGGSTFIDAGNGSSGANAGFVIIGANAGQSGGATAKVQVGDASQQVAFFGSGSFGGGAGVMFIANRTTAPTSNPTGGVICWADSGALKCRGSSGTVTTVAAP